MTERKKFNEEIAETLHTAVQELMEKHPELEGACIALTYAPEFKDLPSSIAIGPINDPTWSCYAAYHVAKLQIATAQGIAQHVLAAKQSFEGRNENAQGDQGPQGSVHNQETETNPRFSHAGGPSNTS